jgi:CubicO group peptidase (beta-lactamase class C family)
MRRGSSHPVLLSLVLATFVPASTGIAQGATLPDSLRHRVDSVFSRWNHTDTPGCSLGISQGGRPVYLHGYGMSDLQQGTAVTPASIFHVASISKEFSAYSIALLANDGRLSLDDNIRKYLPEIPDYGTPITIRHLIYHTSGLRDQWQLLGYAGWRYPDDLITENDVLGIVSRQRGVNFAPGTQYLYSNTGYTLLAVIVKRVSGKSLREFANERIFVPLGMTSTHFHDDHTMIVPGRTSAYDPRDGGGWKVSIPVFDTYGATSLFTTAADLLKWMAMLDTPMAGMAEVVTAAQTSGKLNDGTPINYGYGLSVGRYRGLRAIGHGGADAGYRAQVERYPERGIAIAVLCNAGNSGPGTLLRRVADVLIGSSAPPTQVAADTITRAVSPEVLQRWVGTYRDTISQAVARISVVRDTLRLGDRQVLLLTNDSSARTPGSNSFLRLRMANDAMQSIVALPRGARDVTFRRQAPFTPSRAELGAFAGTYYSEELDVTYNLALGDSGLVVRHRKIQDSRLTPAFPDAFTSDEDVTFIFTRDRSRKVVGFTITDGRMRGVKFARVS